MPAYNQYAKQNAMNDQMGMYAGTPSGIAPRWRQAQQQPMPSMQPPSPTPNIRMPTGAGQPQSPRLPGSPDRPGWVGPGGQAPQLPAWYQNRFVQQPPQQLWQQPRQPQQPWQGQQPQQLPNDMGLYAGTPYDPTTGVVDWSRYAAQQQPQLPAWYPPIGTPANQRPAW